MPPDNDVPTVKPAWMSPIETRQARADYYFRTVLDGQGEWYDKNAGKQKRRYLAFAICVIVLGTLISLLQVLDTADWVPYLTAALGAAVAISRAVDALLRPGETWQANANDTAADHADASRTRRRPASAGPGCSNGCSISTSSTAPTAAAP